METWEWLCPLCASAAPPPSLLPLAQVDDLDGRIDPPHVIALFVDAIACVLAVALVLWVEAGLAATLHFFEARRRRVAEAEDALARQEARREHDRLLGPKARLEHNLCGARDRHLGA